MDVSSVLFVYLQDQLVGRITRFPEDRSIFTFDSFYVNAEKMLTLSQSFLNNRGQLLKDIAFNNRRFKLHPWFSNLLPEGTLRTYLAHLGGIRQDQEFALLQLLGEDLPGAVKIIPEKDAAKGFISKKRLSTKNPNKDDQSLRFSLAGVQLKFSALLNQHGGLTIPARGIGGDWIVKLPSPVYPSVPENECFMLCLAKQVGIPVPDHRLIPLEAIEGLPKMAEGFAGKQALAVKRFDRGDHGQRIHMEDFAQVFGAYPEEKYEKVGFARIATMINLVLGKEAAEDFIGRLVFTILTGNGDMHLKNWSFLYPDGIHPQLSPAYDLVSTIPYLPFDKLALNLSGVKDFKLIKRTIFSQLAKKSLLQEKMVLNALDQMIEKVRYHWDRITIASSLHHGLFISMTDHLYKMVENLSD